MVEEVKCPKCNGHGYTEYMPPQSRVMAAQPCDCTRTDPTPSVVEDGATGEEIKAWKSLADVGILACSSMNEQLAAAQAEIEGLKSKLIEEQSFSSGLREGIREIGALCNTRDAVLAQCHLALMNAKRSAIDRREADYFQQALSAIAGLKEKV